MLFGEEMKKYIYILSLLLCGCADACENYNISSCGYACQQAGKSMSRYSKTEGCVCQSPENSK